MSRIASLSPTVTVEFWRNHPPGGIAAVREADQAHFAVVTVRTKLARCAARFDLPAQRVQLDIALAAANAAYVAGHHKRANMVRSVLGLAPIDTDPTITIDGVVIDG